MLPGGRFRRVQADSQQAGLTGVTVDAQGNVWATESVANRIVKLGTNGRLTHYDVPTPNSRPGVITVGPDGALWFCEGYGKNIGRRPRDRQHQGVPHRRPSRERHRQRRAVPEGHHHRARRRALVLPRRLERHRTPHGGR
jgi:virginiamycin B lyase